MFTQKRTFKSKITQKSCSKSLLKKHYFSKGPKKGFLEVDLLKKVLILVLFGSFQERDLGNHLNMHSVEKQTNATSVTLHPLTQAL